MKSQNIVLNQEPASQKHVEYYEIEYYPTTSKPLYNIYIGHQQLLADSAQEEHHREAAGDLQQLHLQEHTDFLHPSMVLQLHSQT